MQRDLAERSRKRSGAATRKVESWTEIVEQMESRLGSLEKRVYAPLSLRDPAAGQEPIELRLKALEESQKTLLKQLEALRKETERLRRQQRLENL